MVLFVPEVYCCIFTILIGCRCVTYQGTTDPTTLSGVFTSPSYPAPYRTNINCILYTFIAPANSNMIVEIIFQDLDLGEINEHGK